MSRDILLSADSTGSLLRRIRTGITGSHRLAIPRAPRGTRRGMPGLWPVRACAFGPMTRRTSVGSRHGGAWSRSDQCGCSWCCCWWLGARRPVASTRSTPARAAEPPFHELWRAGQASGFDGLGAQRRQRRRWPAGARRGATPAARSEVEWRCRMAATGAAGLAVGPVQATSGQFHELIPSWNAETPPGTWIEVRLRRATSARRRPLDRAGTSSAPGRPSPAGARAERQGPADADGRVSTDTLILTPPANAYQLGLTCAPTTTAAQRGQRRPSRWRPSSPRRPRRRRARSRRAGRPGARPWTVPERSQMVYPNGGPVWCSPTSTSMVMAYWSERLGEPALNQPVPEVAAAVYDLVYHGNGNWPFNTAYRRAARAGRLRRAGCPSLGQVERWIEAGVPGRREPGLVRRASFGNAAVPSTDGHLLVIVGFTAERRRGGERSGRPTRAWGISVRRVYPRSAARAALAARLGRRGLPDLPGGDPDASPRPPSAPGSWVLSACQVAIRFCQNPRTCAYPWVHSRV